MIVRGGAVDGSGRVGHGRGDVTSRQREGGAVHLDGAGQPGQRAPVDHDQLGRRSLVLTVGEEPLDLPETLLDSLDLAAGHESADQAQGEHGADAHDVVRKVLDPAADGGFLSVALQDRDRSLDEVGCPVDVSCFERVTDRRCRLPRVGVPLAGPAVQAHDLAGVFVGQVRAKDVREEMVIAVPAALVVEPDDEQVGPVEDFEHGSAVPASGDGVAQRAVEAAQDGRPEQEVTHVIALAGQDLVDQVVEDVPVVTGESGDEVRDVRAPLECERRQLECGDPALGALLQGFDVRRGKVQSDGFVEVGRYLDGSEAEVGGAQFDQLAAGPQSCERQRRVGAGADHQVHLRREVFEQERHGRLNVRGVGKVVVVEDQIERVRQG
ncbi:hypothetical protein ACFVGN_31790, partial [Streptomyces sp. NPDC057757]|uniref:hypothetical protein n=1 Tax=Streptomyces sp. NPDC057757 TaxID=3346241 RepID=UPI0036CD4661